MNEKKMLRQVRKLCEPFRVDDGKGFRLKDIDPGDTLGFGSEDKPRARQALETGVRVLAGYQEKLYAQDRWAVLLIFQAMDAVRHCCATSWIRRVPGSTGLRRGLPLKHASVWIAWWRTMRRYTNGWRRADYRHRR